MPPPIFDLFLIRHGLTDWNEAGRLMGRSPIALNARGRAQAAALADALRPFSIPRLLCSPQLRAQQTAELIAQVHGLAVQTEVGLDEVWLGRWQGKTWQEIRDDPDVLRFMENPTYVCDAFEPTEDIRARVVKLTEQLRAESAGASLAVVSHGDPIKVLLAHYLAIPLSGYRRLSVDTASVSILRFGQRSGCRLLVLNWRPPGALQQFVAGEPTAREGQRREE